MNDETVVEKKGAWEEHEDLLLAQLVEAFGVKSWSLVAQQIPGRSGKSCRLRCAHWQLMT